MQNKNENKSPNFRIEKETGKDRKVLGPAQLKNDNIQEKSNRIQLFSCLLICSLNLNVHLNDFFDFI